MSRSFSADTRRIDSIFAQTLLGTTIQNFTFDFDVLGTLTNKSDMRRGLAENFYYDGLNRLTNRATGNAATAFVRADGHYVVWDNITGDLVQMSDTRLSVGAGAGQWLPDSTIVNPFIPGP